MPPGKYKPVPFGKYLLTERIGAGGMAEIFRATAFGVEGFTKEICIKRILPTLTVDETFVKMFISEAKLAVNLHHANVVQVFDLGRIGEHYFIAMELVRGRDLLEIINRCRAHRRHPPVPIALYILAQVCKGLDYAHRVKVEGRPAGIIHRDVSPSNILVSWEGEVKVADFGIAKASHKDENTATGTLKGKYGYMSPEQVQGLPIDQRSDIFATGVLLYESLVAKRLFKGTTDLETLERVRAAAVPVPPSSLNKKVSVQIDAIAMKALALSCDDRFQTAGEFHDALADQLFQSGERVDSKTLATFMQKLFAEEIKVEEELERERSRPDLSLPEFAAMAEEQARATPTPTPAGPQTRMDLPSGATPHPARRPLSSLTLGAIGTGAILLAGVLVVVFFWLLNRTETVSQQPDAGGAKGLTIAVPAGGSLTIDSRPKGATIEIDGMLTGKRTPATIDDLDRSETHQVRLSLTGYEPWLKQVRFGKLQLIALEPHLTQKIEKPPPPPPPRKPKFGTLNINAVPVWAYVYVDGKKQSRPTPIYNLKLNPGPHEIRLENPKLKLVQKRQVIIKKGKSVDLVVKMK
ncbi:MAG TPA: protein kinase [Myxococcota bacterium]|nr:protein kinase [Myxococcota bacterium]